MANVPKGIASALDVFVGYAMLDAWIANQDRHHENWAALRDDELRLAPTFDHGAGLARNLTDDERNERVTTKDQNRGVPRFARRARSAFYREANDPWPLGTVDAFREFAVWAPAASEVWLRQLGRINKPTVERILREVPPTRMSSISLAFTLELLVVNQGRLLGEAVST
jgi:hypothetical protein